MSYMFYKCSSLTSLNLSIVTFLFQSVTLIWIISSHSIFNFNVDINSFSNVEFTNSIPS